ncbi:MAG: CPBP family intramembrane metalloprotease [Bdellovibrionales bacterium]|nr:CPBP family intramembrane metalloprotease [Bdellovibrionales bacterium]
MPYTHRQQVGIFLAVTLSLSWLLELYILKVVGSFQTPLLFVLMWIPGLVGIGCSYVCGNGFRDLGLDLPLPKYWAIAYVVPAAVVLLTLIVCTLIGIGSFVFEPGKFLRLAIFLPLLGVVMALVTHSSSELGWRGYLQFHVRQAKIPAPYLMVGLVWSAWLWPLVAFSDYTSSKVPLLSLLTFTLTMTGFSIFLGWLRDRSRSVFTAMLAYAVHTTWLREIVPGFYKPGDLNPYFGGEAGFVMAILYILVAAYVVRREEGFLQV